MLERSRFERELLELGLPGAGPTRMFFAEKVGQAVRLTHYHVRKYLDPGIRALMPDGAASVMTPAQMKPGYVLPGDPRRRDLQKAVDDLLRAKYSAALAPRVMVRVALADLTGVKHHTPVFSGHWAWGAGAAIEAGSLVKILALYALYQLRFDLDTFAARHDIRKASLLRAKVLQEWAREGLSAPPQLTALFRFVEAAGQPVTAKLVKAHDVHHNHVARALIVALGFQYIGSVALQSGLYDETQGGLWLNAAYNKPAITWTSTPFSGLQRHNATALAVATFFTLLAQGRLVDQATSREIGDALGKRTVAGVVSTRRCMNDGPLHGIELLGGVRAPSPNKCGIVSSSYSEGVHVIRQVSGGRRVEYTAAVLSTRPLAVDLKALGQDLDALIVAANP